MAALILPCFLLVAGTGIYIVHKQELADLDDQLAVRVGQIAAQAALGLSKQVRQVESADAASQTIRPQALLNMVRAEQAVRCVEFVHPSGNAKTVSGDAAFIAPRGLGCRNQVFSDEIRIPVKQGSAAEQPFELVVRFDKATLATARHAQMIQALWVLFGGVTIALLSAAIGFRWIVERPLAAVLSAIQSTSSGTLSEVTYRPSRDEMGHVIRAFNNMQSDLRSERHRVEEALEQLQQVYDTTPAMLCSLSAEGRLTRLSEHCSEMLGADPSLLKGRPLADFVSDNCLSLFNSQLLPALDNGEPVKDVPLRIQSEQGQILHVLVSAVPQRSQEIGHHICVMSDVTELNSAQEKLRRQAMTDSLTSLPNRRAMMETISLAMHGQLADGQRLQAVMFIDLDNFKTVNDTLGHEAGDTLLIEAARRLRACASPEDIVGRLGGDEFAILCVADAEPVETLATKIVDTIAKPFELHAATGHVSASIGIVRHGEPTLTPDDLLNLADRAMYVAKRRGKGCYHVDKDHVLTV